MRLTRQTIPTLALPEGKSELIVFDDALPGFGLRIRAGGKRVWIAQYRSGGKQRRVTLGSVEVVDPDQARRQAKQTLAHAQLGRDPQADKREAKARAALTLGAVAKSYLTRHANTRLRPKTLKETERYLLANWRPLHEVAIHKLDRRQIANRIGEIASSSGPVAANRARAALSGLFTWAMREGLCEVNPVIGTNVAVVERSRDRVLSDSELIAIWHACGADDFGRIVQLLILTGQRREEVGGMCWEEVDEQAQLWRIPGERTKNRLPHELPLTEGALAILSGVLRRPNRSHVFGEGKGGFQGWSKAKTSLDRRQRGVDRDFAPWRLHDIRRTVATRMAELGVQPHIIEAVLNHSSGHKAGVAGIYNRAQYRNEKQQALRTWELCIGQLTAHPRLPEASSSEAP